MAASVHAFGGSGTFKHGVHPPERKHFSEDLPIEVVPSPKQVLLPMLNAWGRSTRPAVGIVYGLRQ